MVLTASGAASQSPPSAEGIRWVATFDQAAIEANAAQKPILVHFSKDDDPASTAIRNEVLGDPEVVALSRRFVCVLGCPDRHDTPGKVQACARFGSVGCEAHVRSWTITSIAVSKSPAPTAPQFVFVFPNREPLFRKVGPLEKRQLLGLMERALAWVHPKPPADAEDGERLAGLFEKARSNRTDERRPAISSLAAIDDPRVLAFLAGQLKPEAGEAQRQEALKAIKKEGRPDFLPLIVPLCRESSGQLRRNAIFALRNLEMAEAVPPMIDVYERETTDRLKALVFRTVAKIEPRHEKIVKIFRTMLAGGNPTLRVHAVRAALDLDVRGDDLDLIVKTAAANTSGTVQAVACYVATELVRRAKAPAPEATTSVTEKDGYARASERKVAKELAVFEPKLVQVLSDLAANDKNDKLRDLCAACLEALSGQGSAHHALVLKFHDDAKDEIFKEY